MATNVIMDVDMRRLTDCEDGIQSPGKREIIRPNSSFRNYGSDGDLTQAYQVKGPVKVKELPLALTSKLCDPGGVVRLSHCGVEQCPTNTDGEQLDQSVSPCRTVQPRNSLEIGEKLEPNERKSTKLKINGNCEFCLIETITYNYDGESHIYHYIESAEYIDGTGLKPLDELVSVNGESVINLSQDELKKLFKNIIPKHGDRNIYMSLELRRWNKSTEEPSNDAWTTVCTVEIELVLAPVSGLRYVWQFFNNLYRRARGKQSSRSFQVEKQSEDDTEIAELRPGCISDITVQGAKHLRLKMDDTDQYLLRGSGQLTASILESDASGVFHAELFDGRDESPSPLTERIFCFRLRIREDDWFLTLDVQDETIKPCFKVCAKDNIKTNIDERCFLQRCLNNGMLIESLIYRENFIHYDVNQHTFSMTYIPHTSIDAYTRGLEDGNCTGDRWKEVDRKLDGCWFLYFDADQDGSSRSNIGGQFVQEEHKSKGCFSKCVRRFRNVSCCC